MSKRLKRLPSVQAAAWSTHSSIVLGAQDLMDRAALHEENRDLTESLALLQQECSQLRRQVEARRKEQLQLKDELSECRQQLEQQQSQSEAPSGTPQGSSSSALPVSTAEAPATVSTSPNMFLNKLEQQPGPASRAQARQFVEALQVERRELVAMRESFCAVLRLFAQDLYSSPAHFIQELIQNCDDNGR